MCNDLSGGWCATQADPQMFYKWSGRRDRPMESILWGHNPVHNYLSVKNQGGYFSHLRLLLERFFINSHWVKSVQTRSYFCLYFSLFGLNTGKYRPEITPYLDSLHAVSFQMKLNNILMGGEWTKSRMVLKCSNKFRTLRLHFMEIILSFRASVEKLVLSEHIVKVFEILACEFSSDDVYAKWFGMFFGMLFLKEILVTPHNS